MNQTNNFLKSKNNMLRKGFSLIEIMIVLAIIGGLMALAFTGFRYLERSKVRTTEAKLSQLDVSLEEYRTAMREYPQDLDMLVDGPKDPKKRRSWTEPLATPSDLEDAWGKSFEYEPKGRGAQPPYELYTVSPKGVTIYSPKSRES